jgi:hypothetical protein
MSSISNLSSSFLQSLQSPVATGGASTPKTAKNNGGAKADSAQLSTVARVTSALQQIQQNDPAKYQQVTKQVATNLQSAAQSQGNSQAAGQLNQLASSFTEASNSGQLPNSQSLTKGLSDHSSEDSLNPAAIVLSTLSGGDGH